MSSTVFYERRKGHKPVESDQRRILRRGNNEKIHTAEQRRLATLVRRHQREAFRIPVRFRVQEKDFSGYTHDISPEGLLVFTETSLSAGTPMTLQFSFGQNVCHLNISGQVVFCRLAENGESLRQAIGIKFSAIREFEQKILTSAVQELKQNAPTKEKSLLNILVTPDTLAQEVANFSNRSKQIEKNSSINEHTLPPFLNMKTQMDKRLESRRITDRDEKVLIELSLSYPNGKKITKEVLDFSESGLSFKMSVEEGFFPVGTPLNNIVIRNGQKTYKTLGQVIYVTTLKEDENESYRIGIKFNREHKRFLGAKVSSIFPLRPRRYSSKEIPECQKNISFRDQEGNLYTGMILDFSRFGAAFILEKDSPVFRVSQILQDFNIFMGNENVFTGNATIINLRNGIGSLTIGVSFENNQIDIDKMFYLGIKSSLEQPIAKSIPTFKVSSKIDPSFKSEVADLRYFLENLKKEFEKHELQVQNETTEKRKVFERCILESAAKHAYQIINASMSNIATTIKDYDKNLDDIHKEYFRAHLHELLLSGPFINRSYKKPLGYAGDYEMMNMLYREPYEGATLFGKFINGYAWQLPSAKAVRYRAQYMLSKMDSVIGNVISKEETHIASITSIGCGSSKEIQDFLNNNDKSNQCEINLIDLDRNALLYCQDKILEIKALKKRKSKINFLHKSINDILAGKDNAFFKKQDLIYSLGLFDYLTTDVSRDLIRIFYEVLNPNGTLIIGNFGPSIEMSNRKQMEYVTEWYLIHRSDKEMLDLSSKLPPSKECLIDKDPLNVNNFLIIIKKR